MTNARTATDLSAKRILITGGARGQGACEARLFAERGARVLVADVLHDQGRELVGQIGDAARYVELNVSDPSAWEQAMVIADEEFGGLDVLVNNAGILRPGGLEDTTLADFQATVDINQLGCFLGMRAAVRPMAAAGGGSIVNISSVAGLKGIAGMMGYVASKWAIRGMTKAAALELGVHGIRVNSVHPGAIETDMTTGPDFDHIDRARQFRDLPVPRMGSSADVAELVAFLASDASSYCTGGEFLVDGGVMAGQPVARA